MIRLFKEHFMDRIYIRDLMVDCIVGVFPEEHQVKQNIIINLEIGTDLRKAGRSDNLNDTVDYMAIKEKILRMLESSRFKLIESLAERIADIVLEDEKVQQVRVTVDKPGALRFANSSAVEITRTRE